MLQLLLEAKDLLKFIKEKVFATKVNTSEEKLVKLVKNSVMLFLIKLISINLQVLLEEYFSYPLHLFLDVLFQREGHREGRAPVDAPVERKIVNVFPAGAFREPFYRRGRKVLVEEFQPAKAFQLAVYNL